MNRGKAKVRFDAARDAAVDFCRRHRDLLGDDTVLVRDIVGRIRIALFSPLALPQAICEELDGILGAWSPGIGSLLLVGSELLDPDAIFKSPEARPVAPGLRFLDRRISARDWISRNGVKAPAALPTIAFFGVKGGVGRSTALSVIARRLAEKGQRVMVMDLDLESPGVSSLLLPEAGLPSFGIVDWLVESGVGQADEELLLSMIAPSMLANGTAGQIQVMPAAGDKADTYVAKLARIQTSSDAPSGYGAALARLLDAIARLDRPPTVVLLDCRAGIDDLAAVAITSLATEALLFAVGTPQTWLAYRMLFSIWNKDARVLDAFREKLQIVAGLVPETERDAYMARLRGNAYDLFAEFLYEEEPSSDGHDPTAPFDVFNFDPEDGQAPHFAIPVLWRRELQDFDPINRPEAETRDGLSAFDELARYVEGCLPAASGESHA
jgi:hypothetical protein